MDLQKILNSLASMQWITPETINDLKNIYEERSIKDNEIARMKEELDILNRLKLKKKDIEKADAELETKRKELLKNIDNYEIQKKIDFLEKDLATEKRISKIINEYATLLFSQKWFVNYNKYSSNWESVNLLESIIKPTIDIE